MITLKNSREAAKTLRAIAEFLDSRPEFELEYYNPSIFSFYSKETFVVAAKAIGNATKSVDEGEYAQFKLTSDLAPVVLTIQRDRVCKKEIKYDCEPLFSSEEVNAL